MSVSDPIFRLVDSTDHSYLKKSGGDWIARTGCVDPLKKLQNLVGPESRGHFAFTAISDRFLESKIPDNNLTVQEAIAFRSGQFFLF
jgi:hypothetical protein